MNVAFLSKLLTFGMAGLLLACASNQQSVTQPNMPAKSDDILTLLTGFGESLSKRDFVFAVNHLTPKEREQILDARGQVPEAKRQQLAALNLQRLIRLPSVRVEDGRLAGIYEMLPNLNQGEGVTLSADDESSQFSVLDPLDPDAMENAAQAQADAAQDKTELNETINRFFAAVKSQNWNDALALLNENERRLFVDNRGQISEDAKARFSQMDKSHPGALALKDGKLLGITLLLPSP